MKLQHERIDATNQSFGRVASRIATILQGKTRPDFHPSSIPPVAVRVENVRRVRFTGKKLSQSFVYHFSGYPGGLKKKSLGELFKKSPETMLRRAVANMLPKNKLQKRLLQRLTIVP